MLWIHFPFFLAGKAGISVALFSVHEPWPAETDPRAGRVLRMWDSELRLWTQQKRGGHSSQVRSVFIVYREKGLTWFLCMLLFVWNCAKILCNHIKVFARNSCMLLFVSFSCKEFAWNSCKFQMRFMWVTFACVAILLQITTKRDGFTASNHNWQ